MGSSSISIVPKISIFPNKERKIIEIIDWLIASEIIQPEVSDCVLDMNKQGYAPSFGIERIIIDPGYISSFIDLKSNGLEISDNRNIYTAMEGGLDELNCPHCYNDLINTDHDFFNKWHSGHHNQMTCPVCKTPSEINDYIYSPQWGFSDLAFIFWNWPSFTPEFINEFSNRLEQLSQ